MKIGGDKKILLLAFTMAGQDQLELKFRLHDGTDIGPNRYPPFTTVATLKENILAQWPRGLGNGPKTISDMKLINAGKVLENNKTLAESRVPVGELLGGVITMHVVVKPIIKTEKLPPGSPKKKHCACCIL